MATKKEKHYSLDAIDKIDSQYKLIIGEKSNGKSYAVKLKLLKEAWETGIPFFYVRRYVEDVKAHMVERYFNDMVENDDGKREIYDLTDGECECVQVFRGGIYFATKDEKGEVKRIRLFAYYMAIPQYEHFTSQAFVKINRILFEEFIAPLGKPFLPKEYNTFMLIVSTIFRRRAGCIVYMIANTNKLVCPYFDEWGITVEELERGMISVFHHDSGDVDEDKKRIIIDIAVEYCENTAGTDRMILGKKRNVMTKGEWDTNSYPHLEQPFKTYRKWYVMYFRKSRFTFVIRLLSDSNRMPFLYVYPASKDEMLPENARIVEEGFSLNPRVTQSFSEFRTRYDELVYTLLKEGKVCYSTNMCGTTFNELLKMRE